MHKIAAAALLLGGLFTAPAVQEAPFVFQVISDPHTSYTKLTSALDDLRQIGPTAQALVVNGDITNSGTQLEYDRFKNALGARPHPKEHVTIGNHEFHGADSSAVENERFRRNFGLDRVYYEQTIGGFPFLFLGGENGDDNPPNLARKAVLSDAQLDWLQARLAAVSRAGRPSFVFLHQPPAETDVTQFTRFRQILASHPNVVLFSGHWHADLRIPDIRYFTNSQGFWQVNSGGIHCLHDSSGRCQPSLSQGLQVEVSADRVAIKGRDFAGRQWLGGFQHVIPLEDNPDANGAVTDFDGDGRADLVGQWAGGELTAYTASGQTRLGSDFHLLKEMVLIDRNGDGKKDVFGVWPNGQTTTYLNVSTPAHPAISQQPTTGSAWHLLTRLTVIDIDGDGRDDLLGRWEDGTLRAYFGTGGPDFEQVNGVDSGWRDVTRVRVADADGDGRQDLIATWADGGLSVHVNKSTGRAPAFEKHVLCAAGCGWDQLSRITVVDADRDGKDDLLGRWRSGQLTAYLNTGTPGRPGFGVQKDLDLGWNGVTRLVEADGDLVGRWTDGRLTVFRNDGTPGQPLFTKQQPYGSGWGGIVRVPVS